MQEPILAMLLRFIRKRNKRRT